MERAKLAGIALLLTGMVVGVVYPFALVYYKERAIEIIIYTIAAISIAIGSFIGAVGLLLLRGFKGSGEAEDTS